MESEPPSKRRRLSEASSDKTLSARRSDSFWLCDGNIILQADQTQFKVHQSVLSLHSSIFRDMFSVPQPQDRDSQDGCPLVVLHDSPTDVHNLLSLMYTSLSVINRSCKPTYSVICSMLRLGKKYDIVLLWEQAIQLIKEDLPHLEKEYLTVPSGCRGAVDIVCLAREHSLRYLLRASYWVLFIWQHTIQIADQFSSLSPEKKARLGDNEPATLLKSRECVRQWLVERTFDWLKFVASPGVACRDPANCNKSKLDLSILFLQSDPNLLLSYAMKPNQNLPVPGFCYVCQSSWRRSRDTRIRELWKDFFQIACLQDQVAGWSDGDWNDRD